MGIGILLTWIVLFGTGCAGSDDSKACKGTIKTKNKVQADFPSLAKITPAQAAQKALSAVQGKVSKTELEDENGFLVYGVEVVMSDKSIVDVKVDAGSGKILTMDRDKADDNDHGSGEDEGDKDRDE